MPKKPRTAGMPIPPVPPGASTGPNLPGPAGGPLSSFRVLPIDLIDTEGQSIREALDDDHVAELALSIARHGLLQPIVIRPLPDGRYQLVAGFHRLVAHHKLKLHAIDVHIISAERDPASGLSLVENVCRRPITLAEEVAAVNSLHYGDCLSPSQICDLTSKSRSWVDRRLAAPGMPENLRAALFDGMITLGAAEEIYKVQDAGVQAQILNTTIYSKLPITAVRDLVRVYQEAPSISDAVDAGVKEAQELSQPPPVTVACEACHTHRPYHELARIWVCLGGCPQPPETPKEQPLEPPP